MRILFVSIFLIWSIVGAIITGAEVIAAHKQWELGVGTSAAITMDIMFWIGGCVILGIIAIMSRDLPKLDTTHGLPPVNAAP